jgi:hypothetical protein
LGFILLRKYYISLATLTYPIFLAGCSMAAKVCFGVLDQIFPLTARGLREVPAGCFECPKKVLCLKTALDSPAGLDLRAGLVERASGGGLIGRIKSWSQKKQLSRLKEKAE